MTVATGFISLTAPKYDLFVWQAIGTKFDSVDEVGWTDEVCGASDPVLSLAVEISLR